MNYLRRRLLTVLFGALIGFSDSLITSAKTLWASWTVSLGRLRFGLIMPKLYRSKPKNGNPNSK
jgi:hypothetical protein